MRAMLVRRSRWWVAVLFAVMVISADAPSPAELARAYRQARDRAVQSGADRIVPALPIARADGLAKDAATSAAEHPADAARLYQEAMWALPRLAGGTPQELVRILGNPTLRQPGTVTCIAFDRSLQRLITGNTDKTSHHNPPEPAVRVWDVSNGSLLFEYRGHHDPVRGVAALADGRIASAAGKEIHLWKIGEAAKVVTGPSAPVTCLAGSPDGGRFVAGGEDRVVRLWDTARIDDSITLNVQNSTITDVAISAKLVASVNAEGTLTVWEISKTPPRQVVEQRVLATNSSLTGVSIAPDDESVAVCGERVAKTIMLPKPDGTTEPIGTIKRAFEGANGHTDMVRTLAYSPDGKCLATAGSDESVRLWDVGTGQLLRTLLGHTEQINAVAFSSDGNRLYSGGVDQSIRIWDIESSAPVRTFAGHRGAVWSAVPSPDGRLLATAGADHVIRIWDLATGKELRQLTGHEGPVTAVAFLPDGRSLVSTSGDRTVRIWNVDGGTPRVLSGHDAAVLALAVTPDGQRLATSGADRTVQVWDIAAQKQTSQWTVPRSTVTALAYRPDGLRLAVATADGMIRIADPASGANAVTFKAHDVGGVAGMAFSSDGHLLVSCGGDQLVKGWDANAPAIKEPVFRLAGHTGPVSAIAVSPNGKLIASAGADRTVKVWNPLTRAEVQSFRGHAAWVGAVAFTPDGTSLISASVDGRTLQWRLPRLEEERDIIGHTRALTTMVALPDGNLLTAAQDRKLIRWNLSTGVPTNTMNLPATVMSLAVARDGQFVLGGGDDKRIRRWDLATTKEARIYEPQDRVQLLTILPKNEQFLTWHWTDGGDNDVTSVIHRFDIKSGDNEEIVSEIGKAARALTFSNDGALAAVGSHQGTLRIWNLETKAKFAEDFPAHAQAVIDVAFTPDKKLLLSGDRDGEIKAWRVEAKPGAPVFTITTPTKSVEALTVAPNGSYFAASGGGTIAVFETQTGKLVRSIQLPHVATMIFLGDGRQMAAGLTDGTIAILNFGGQ